MRIVYTRRSFEPCSESGWFGYDVYLEKHTGESFARALSELGETVFMLQLKKPLLVVRTKDFLIRCVLGNSFIKVGVAQNDPKLLDKVLEAISGAE